MKDIKGFEGLYAITENGKVWSYPKRCSSKKGMWMKLNTVSAKDNRPHPKKYLSIKLRKNGKYHPFLVHRLVALAYVPNPENKPFINHIDGNSLNPHRDNLEWVTNKENSAHAFSTGLVKKPMTDNEVIELRKICKFYSCRKVALAYGLHPGTVWDINSRRRYADVP
jgi:hypothetical protein